jgi:2-amino-4-hydroxy-6-hydroxymethyldihydropteridine diphosphokinase
MTRAVLSLGSNLGDRYQFLRDAVAALGDEALVVSGVYESEPWPAGDPAPWYLNAAVLVAAAADAGYWLQRAQALERAAGRVRQPGPRHPPRTLDVDVIMVWDDAGEPVMSSDPALVLPHPRAHLRAFVLRPWLDIAPYARLPGHGWLTDLLRTEPVADDLARVRARPDLPLVPDPSLESKS